MVSSGQQLTEVRGAFDLVNTTFEHFTMDSGADRQIRSIVASQASFNLNVNP